MKTDIICDDEYEAQKLMSLIFIKEDKETYISGILNVIKNEIIISLKDKSAHSILLKDEELKDLNSQIELIPIDSNVSGVVHNNKNLVLETDNKIIKEPSFQLRYKGPKIYNSEINENVVFKKGTPKKLKELNALAEDPELTNTLYFTPNHFDHFFSKLLTILP